MHPDKMAEEILERFWIETVEEGNDTCDVAVLADDPALRHLERDGYIRVTDHKAVLTPKGHGAAAGCIRRHRLAERLLVDVLDLKKPLVHETGCEFEHLLHHGLDENICTLLGHPKTCPHGKPIPEGPCCREARRHSARAILPLPELPPDTRAAVSYLHTHNRDALQKLIAIGILPKTELSVLQRSPSLVLQIGRSQFAIDKELASYVYVRKT